MAEQRLERYRTVVRIQSKVKDCMIKMFTLAIFDKNVY